MNARVVVASEIGNFFSVSKKQKASDAGAFPRAMDALSVLGLTDTPRANVRIGRPFIRTCIGMHWILNYSAMLGGRDGRPLFEGGVEHFASVDLEACRIRVPSTCWSRLRTGEHFTCAPFAAVKGGTVYFVHQYNCSPADPACVPATVDDGGVCLTAPIRLGNIIGLQFLLERSGAGGKRILALLVEDRADLRVTG